MAYRRVTMYHFVIGGRANVVEPAGGGGEERRTTRAVAGGRKGLIVRPCGGAFHAYPIGLLVGLLRQLCRKTTKQESKLLKNWAEKGALLLNLRIIDLWFCFTFFTSFSKIPPILIFKRS